MSWFGHLVDWSLGRLVAWLLGCLVARLLGRFVASSLRRLLVEARSVVVFLVGFFLSFVCQPRQPDNPVSVSFHSTPFHPVPLYLVPLSPPPSKCPQQMNRRVWTLSTIGGKAGKRFPQLRGGLSYGHVSHRMRLYVLTQAMARLTQTTDQPRH